MNSKTTAALSTLLLALVLSCARVSAQAETSGSMPPLAPDLELKERFSGWADKQNQTPSLRKRTAKTLLKHDQFISSSASALPEMPEATGSVPKEMPKARLANLAPGLRQEAQVYVYEFSASWCPSCVKLEPFVEATMNKYRGFARYIPVNVDRNQDLMSQMNVAQIPTILVMDTNGRLLNRLIGLQQGSQLELILEHYKAESEAQRATAK